MVHSQQAIYTYCVCASAKSGNTQTAQKPQDWDELFPSLVVIHPKSKVEKFIRHTKMPRTITYKEMKGRILRVQAMIEAWTDPAASGYNPTLRASTKFVVSTLALAVNNETGTKIGTDKFVLYLHRWENIEEECRNERKAWKEWKATQRRAAEAQRVAAPQFKDDRYG